ncbi:serine/threonine-protein kinase [Thalassovita sp.]|uniref:serine/threonine-protein kinase n=1 Tax=Thalassovita sp. TaxID=1979401 RepID=UPI0029DE7D41|nr:serine/threonine-protein kinase [Thalassovita sp.]
MQKTRLSVTTQEAFLLPVGTRLLKGQYELLGHLAEGGFGITYLARDSLERMVVIKECFPYELCTREHHQVRPRLTALQENHEEFVASFVAEARQLARLNHPNIVKVHQVFEENGTAYMAMDYVEGQELLDVRDVTPTRLTPQLLEKTLKEVLEALRYLHQVGVLHRDISPDNLLLDARDKITLIDFGASREASRSGQTGSKPMLAVKDGYSPFEFYGAGHPHRPSSDLYSLGATYYRLITGHAPHDGNTRYQCLKRGQADPYRPLSVGKWPFEPRFLSLIDQALVVDPARRLHSAEAWLAGLGCQSPTGTRAQARPRTTQPLMPEKELAKVISRMVQAANSTPEMAKPAPAPAAADPAPTVREQPARQPVDIFGNPIEDVDAWMREQDRIISKRQQKQAAASAPPIAPTPATPRKSLLSWFRLGRRRQHGAPLPHSNN